MNPASDNEHGLRARALPVSEAEFDRIIRINRIQDLHLNMRTSEASQPARNAALVAGHRVPGWVRARRLTRLGVAAS